MQKSERSDHYEVLYKTNAHITIRRDGRMEEAKQIAKSVLNNPNVTDITIVKKDPNRPHENVFIAKAVIKGTVDAFKDRIDTQLPTDRDFPGSKKLTVKLAPQMQAVLDKNGEIDFEKLNNHLVDSILNKKGFKFEGLMDEDYDNEKNFGAIYTKYEEGPDRWIAELNKVISERGNNAKIVKIPESSSPHYCEVELIEGKNKTKFIFSRGANPIEFS